MGLLDGYTAGRRQPERRLHSADGISPDARAVIGRHGLDRGRILDIAGRYAAQKGVDFNEAPAQDFEGGAARGQPRGTVHSNPAFDAFRVQFDAALESLDYAASDAVIDRCLAAGIVVNSTGKSVYGEWRRSAERLEGLNAGPLRGRMRRREAEPVHWEPRRTRQLPAREVAPRGRRAGQGAGDRGESSRLLEKGAVAMVTYSAGALAGWTLPVRYPPHPCSPDAGRERFGAEKGGATGGRGNWRAGAGCTPARDARSPREIALK